MKRSTWELLENDGERALQGVVNGLVGAGPRVSAYECASKADVELVAVAMSSRRANQQHFHYVEIEPDDLSDVDITVSMGKTWIPDADCLHRDLHLSEDRARQLVLNLSARNVVVQEIRIPALRELARQLRDAGQPIPESSGLLR